MKRPASQRENLPEQLEQKKSRSGKKRESAALQRVGEDLARLAPAELASLDLPEDLALALDELRNMKTREARRRQIRYIGRLLRQTSEAEAQGKRPAE
jgi:ribosome-associated protein